MQTRKLGRSSLDVSTLALGSNIFGWTIDEAESFAVLDAYVAAGGNFIDTADVYSMWVAGNQGGEAETIIGNWMKRRGNRKQLIIATKVGWEMGARGLKKSYVHQAVEASLRRLQTDYIDLYQSHKDDPDTPVEETLEAHKELVEAGKVRVIGASNFGAARLAESLEVSRRRGWPRYESLQPLYNLYNRAEYEAELEPLCVKEGLGVIPYYALASGFLTGKYHSERDLSVSARGAGVGKKYLNDRGLRIVAALEEVARELRSVPATAAVAWLIARPSVTAAISSATSTQQLRDLIAATELHLDHETIDRLDQASAYDEPAAARTTS